MKSLQHLVSGFTNVNKPPHPRFTIKDSNHMVIYELCIFNLLNEFRLKGLNIGSQPYLINPETSFYSVENGNMET